VYKCDVSGASSTVGGEERSDTSPLVVSVSLQEDSDDRESEEELGTEAFRMSTAAVVEQSLLESQEEPAATASLATPDNVVRNDDVNASILGDDAGM